MSELPPEVWDADPEGEPEETPNAVPEDEGGHEGDVEEAEF
ncbi:MAG TPA: hypothetical protein VGB03_02235 [Acidimicrobiales bacterium]|jgi:hypothetical protein